jgi:D-alanyl-lipoteichoic acid acyltransferase DltB (MBOAT superfamily)
VAGPIERSANLLPQFQKVQTFSYRNYSLGMRLMLLGFFKKVVIADNLSVVMDRYYDNLEIWPGPLLVLGVVLFTVQIYCDFSAYSDIARGAAKVLGFDLMQNFDHPYFARSISEFWHRWHISLSQWFRDYVYIPLGGNRRGTARKRLNLFITFMVSGLWHGANWTYVAWGALHGLYQIVENIIAEHRKKRGAVKPPRHPRLQAAVQTLFTFALVCFAYIFFRSDTFGQAWYIISHSIRGWGALLSPVGFWNAAVSLMGSVRVLLITLFATAALFVLECIEMRRQTGFARLLDGTGTAKRWLIYYAVLFAIALFGCFEASSFIYFQF